MNNEKADRIPDELLPDPDTLAAPVTLDIPDIPDIPDMPADSGSGSEFEPESGPEAGPQTASPDGSGETPDTGHVEDTESVPSIPVVAEEEEEDPEAAASAEAESHGKWYVVHTYSGYENTVRSNIDKFVLGRNMKRQIFRMEVPVEHVTEIRQEMDENGEYYDVPREVERKIYPGYVFVKMVLDDETWHLIRNIRGVTGFVGAANDALPLSDKEAIDMGLELPHEDDMDVIPQRPDQAAPRIVYRGPAFQEGDVVNIIDGVLKGREGRVVSIDLTRRRITLVISTPAQDVTTELDLDQVAAQE